MAPASLFLPTLETRAFFTDPLGLVIQDVKTKHHLGKVSEADWTLQETSKGISSLNTQNRRDLDLREDLRRSWRYKWETVVSKTLFPSASVRGL